MVVHHLVTIALLYFSWCCNFVRIGTLVLVVHDAVDYWMAVSQRERERRRQETERTEKDRQKDISERERTDISERERESTQKETREREGEI